MILVTGATGHIGNVLVRELCDRGEQVRVLLLPGEDASALDTCCIQRCEGDILAPATLDAAFAGIDLVYHLAGIISIMPGKNELVQRVNVRGTQNVIDACRRNGVRRLVYTSSIHALERPPHGVIVDESLQYDPNNNVGEYDRSKARATLEVLDAVRRHGLDAVIICPTGVIGPYDYRRSEMGNLIWTWMRTGLHLIVDGFYDFVDVRDVVKGMIQAARRGRCGESYILSGERISLANILRTVQDAAGTHAPHLTIPIPLAKFFANFTPYYYRLTRQKPRFTPYSIETVQSNCNISHAKAQRELDYQPRALHESIADTVAWWGEQG